MRFSPHDEFEVTVGTEDGNIDMFDLRNLSEVKCRNSDHTGTIRDLDYCPDMEGLLSSASDDSTVRVFRKQSDESVECVWASVSHTDHVRGAKWIPRQNQQQRATQTNLVQLASVSWDSTLRLVSIKV